MIGLLLAATLGVQDAEAAKKHHHHHRQRTHVSRTYHRQHAHPPPPAISYRWVWIPGKWEIRSGNRVWLRGKWDLRPVSNHQQHRQCRH